MGLIDIIAQVQAGKVAAATETAPECAGKPYRPGSGTEGMAFDEAWCAHCERDKEFRSDPDIDPARGCQIIADTFAFEISDPRYPKEWIYDRTGKPCCTAFTTDPKQPVRCDKTIDMFGP
jgi:hypothetical protein